MSNTSLLLCYSSFLNIWNTNMVKKVKIIKLYIYIYIEREREKIVMPCFMPHSLLPLIHSSTYCLCSWLLFSIFHNYSKAQNYSCCVSFSPFYLKYSKSHSISVHSLFNYNLLNQFSIWESKAFIFSVLYNNK